MLLGLDLRQDAVQFAFIYTQAAPLIPGSLQRLRSVIDLKLLRSVIVSPKAINASPPHRPLGPCLLRLARNRRFRR